MKTKTALPRARKTQPAKFSAPVSLLFSVPKIKLVTEGVSTKTSFTIDKEENTVTLNVGEPTVVLERSSKTSESGERIINVCVQCRGIPMKIKFDLHIQQT
jgi:hypothetical protein